jgi:hypothetical protein
METEYGAWDAYWFDGADEIECRPLTEPDEDSSVFDQLVHATCKALREEEHDATLQP